MYEFTIRAESFDEENLIKNDIRTLIDSHINLVAGIIGKDLEYYKGNHKILNRSRSIKDAPNNKVVCNHAKDIADTSTGYFMSNAIKYDCKDDEKSLDELTDCFDMANLEDVDHDNALDMSRCGVAYDYTYVKEGTTTLATINLNPMRTFEVYDDSIEANHLMTIYYDVYKDDVKSRERFIANVFTKNYKYTLVIVNDGTVDQTVTEVPVPHMMGGIPIVMYKNNKECFSDYHCQIPLIDAYNTLMSDRVNDKQQFIDSLLVIYGATLADDDAEASEAIKILRDHGYLEMPDASKAEYITRTFDEVGVETLRKAIKEDIYAFSHVPNLTDENFVGNSSGVAMEYKLLGLEMITKTKERYYKAGLKKRIILYCNYLGLKAISINPNMITCTFARSLPKNLTEIAQMVTNLKGTVSKKTLLNQIPFVEDADAEVEEVDEENRESVVQQQQMFTQGNNNPISKEDSQSPDKGDREDEETAEDSSIAGKDDSRLDDKNTKERSSTPADKAS